MQIVVQAAAFFELSGEDVIDPDVALKQLEWIRWELTQLDRAQKEALTAFVLAEAEKTGDPASTDVPVGVPAGSRFERRKRLASLAA